MDLIKEERAKETSKIYPFLAATYANFLLRIYQDVEVRACTCTRAWQLAHVPRHALLLPFHALPCCCCCVCVCFHCVPVAG